MVRAPLGRVLAREMRNEMRLSLRMLATAVLLASAPFMGRLQAQSAQLVVKFVAADGSPVAGVEMRLGGLVQPTRSDSTGRIVIGAPVGQVRIQARALGFSPLDTTLTLRGREQGATLRMFRTVQQLEPTIIEAVLPYGKPLRYQHTGRFDDFYERRARRPGTFFTREDIERSGRNTAMELMSTAPGVTLNWRNGSAVVRVARCTATSIFGGPRDRGDGDHPWLSVFIDGQRIGRFGQRQIETLASLKASEIETMEVYRGPSQLPLEAVGDACAAVFITTRYTTGSVLPRQ